jgi:hypothetical protein
MLFQLHALNSADISNVLNDGGMCKAVVSCSKALFENMTGGTERNH